MQEAFEYFLDSIAAHLTAAEDWPRLWTLLQNFEFLSARIERGDIDGLINDFEGALARFGSRTSGSNPPGKSIEDLPTVDKADEGRARKVQPPPVNQGSVQWTPPAVQFGEALPPDKQIGGPIARRLYLLQEHARKPRESYERSEVDRVKDFAVFVRTQRTTLVYDPGEILSIALNASRWSACSIKGEAEAKASGRPFLRRRGRLPELYDAYTEIDPALAPRELVRGFAADEHANLVAVSSPKSAAVWDVTTRSPLLRVGVSKTKHSCIAISANGAILGLGHTDGTVSAWDIDRSVQLLELRPSEEAVRTVALSANGDELFVGSLNRIISYEVSTAKKLREYFGDRLDSPWCIAEAAAPGLLLSGHSRGYLSIWERATGKCLDILSGGAASKRVVSLDASEDGRFLTAGYGDNSVRVWDRQTRQCLRRLLIGRGSGLNSVSMSSDGGAILGCEKKQFLRLFDVDSGKFLKILSAHGNDITGARPSKSFDRFVSASTEGVIRTWTTEGMFNHSVPVGHNGPVKSLCLSRDGKRLVSGSTDKTVRIWQAVFPKCLSVLRGHTDTVWGVAWLNDNNCVSFGRDLRVCLWSLKHESCTRIIECHPWTGLLDFEKIYNAASRSIAVFRDGKLVVFELLTGREVVIDHEFAAHADFVGWVGDKLYFATGPDGQIFVVEGNTAKPVMNAGAAVRDLIAGPDQSGIVVAATDGVSWFDAVKGSASKISPRPTTVGLYLIGTEVCIVGHDRSVDFVDLVTGVQRQIRTEAGRDTRRGSLKTSIDQFRYLASEDSCLSVHGRFFRLWEPQSGAVNASYFAESDILCTTPRIVGSTLACGTGIGQIHFLVLHRERTGETDEEDGADQAATARELDSSLSDETA